VPFDRNGKWKTTLGDAGEHTVTVTASDGKTTAAHNVTIVVGLRNTAPILAPIAEIVVKEGDLITLPINATDREGDNITLRIDGWITTQTYRTTHEDAGNYTVRVTASDGTLSTSQEVRIRVLDVNRPPVFIIPG
jgi:hypothetical protein